MTALFTITTIIGITLIITKSYLFENFRENQTSEFFYTLFHCPQCASVWVGLFVGIIVSPTLCYNIYETILWILGVSFSSSGFADIIEKIIYKDDEER